MIAMLSVLATLPEEECSRIMNSLTPERNTTAKNTEKFIGKDGPVFVLSGMQLDKIFSQPTLVTVLLDTI